MATDGNLAGLRFDRRSALALAGRAGAALAVATSASGLISGCTDRKPDLAKDRRPLVMTLLDMVIPGSARPDNADFLDRAVKGGMMGVPADLLLQMEELLDARAGGTFAKLDKTGQTGILVKLDAETFAPDAQGSRPWYPLKALMLMAYYTSETGMTEDLRYDLVPGRYEVDIVIDPAWRPLANDWQAVAIDKGIIGK